MSLQQRLGESRISSAPANAGPALLDQHSIESFMRAAMIEGRKAVSICGDNPPVGCVIVQDGIIVSRGHTNRPGEDHAEAMALNSYGKEFVEAVAFVTLEPCSFQCRTPSCAKALIDAGINKVVVGLIDPDPRNNGKGIAMLEAAGITVRLGVLQDEVELELGKYLNSRLDAE